MRQTNNLHVVDTNPLVTPTALKQELPISEQVAETVATTRDAIRAILQGEDRRLLAVVGPCSIHDVDAARDKNEHQLKARAELQDRLLMVMRVYFEQRRMRAVVGPCSIHDVDAARDYAEHLLKARAELQDRLLIVMRVYFEKPRTTTGWKGLINDPHLDDSADVNAGLRIARKLMLDVLDLGLP